MSEIQNNQIDVNVLYFASVRKHTGRKKETIQLPHDARVKTLKERIGQRYPALESSLPTILTSVNQVFSDDETSLSDQDEVALFPHVSGGMNP
jgi:molybdopterin converting factor subunit 1